MGEAEVRRTPLLECGGERIATPLWIGYAPAPQEPKRRRRFALPAHSKGFAPSRESVKFVSRIGMVVRRSRALPCRKTSRAVAKVFDR